MSEKVLGDIFHFQTEITPISARTRYPKSYPVFQENFVENRLKKIKAIRPIV